MFVKAGALDPEFHLPPAAKVQCLMPLVGLRQDVDQPVPDPTTRKTAAVCPGGAGLCVRRSTAVAYAELLDRLSISHLLDRRGQRLFSGGDDLLSWVAARGTGSGFSIFPALRIVHLSAPNASSRPTCSASCTITLTHTQSCAM